MSTPSAASSRPESVRPDLRLVPIALAAWAATWAGTSGITLAVVATAGAAAVAAAAGRLRRSWWWASAAAVLLAGAAVGLLHQARVAGGPVHDLAQESAAVSVELITRTDPQVRTGTRSPYVVLRGTAVAVTGRGATWRVRAPVLVVAGGAQLETWSRLPVGTTVVASARLQAPENGSDVSAVVRVRGPTHAAAPPSPALRQVERVRAGLRRAVAERRLEQRALVPALVLGDTSAMTQPISDDFQATGLSHLTAVSGANLTLLLAFLFTFARWVGVRGGWLRLVGLAGVVIFVGLCRTEPSVLRAAAMGVVGLVALGAGGTAKGLRHLAVAVLALLLVDPYLSRSVGFTLSVLASGGIVWWAGRWSAVLGRWLPSLVAESIAVPLAAHLATVAVVAAIAGQVSVVGILANVVAGPFVGPATVLGFAAAGLSLLSPVAAAAAGFCAAWSAQVILWTAHVGAQFPGASWPWPSGPAGIVVLAAVSLTIAWLAPAVLRYRWAATAVAVVLVVGFLRAPGQPGWPARDWVVVA